MASRRVLGSAPARRASWAAAALAAVLGTAMAAGQAGGPRGDGRERVGPVGAKVDPLAGQRDRLRRDGQRMLWNADYAEMARIYGELSGLPDAPADDRLWHGHAWQLAGKWREAVDAYRAALDAMERHIASGDEKEPNRLATLKDQWAQLLLQIGRLEMAELNDPNAAAKTLRRSLQYVPEGARPIAELADAAVEAMEGRPATVGAPPGVERRMWFELMMPLAGQRYLAAACERLGRPAEAVEALTRIRLCEWAYRAAMAEVDGQALAALWAKLPPDARRPDMPLFVVLGPDKPEAVVKPAEGRSRLACWGAGPSAVLGVVAAPGQAIATLTIRTTAAQASAGAGGVSCRAASSGRNGISGMALAVRPIQADANRPTAERTFEIAMPWDAELLLVEVPGSNRADACRDAALRATFRPRRQGAAPPQPPAAVNCQFLPEGGTTALDGRADMPWDSLTPGRHTFAYSHPKAAARYEEAFDVLPGRRYGLSVNLDCPFRPIPFNLPAFSTLAPAHPSLVRLPGGGWLMAYTAGGPQHERILLTASRDGTRWDEPWEFPHNSIFQTSRPSLAVGHGGTLWMIYFSKRLDTAIYSSGYYHLWATSSPDGRKWSQPKPLRMAQWSQYHQVAQVTRDPKGRCWVLVNDLCGWGDSPGSIGDLTPMALDRPEGVHPENPCATFDDAGRCHLVFDDFGRGIHYTRSDDMKAWMKPTLLAAAEPNSRARFAQLLVQGRQAALIYEASAGSCLRRGELTADGLQLGEPIRIAGHSMGLNGAKAVRDGEMLYLPAGTGENAWLLRARFAEVLGSPAERR